MCGLFGVLDCNNRLSEKEKNKLLRSLAAESEVRGIDASGIAYNEQRKNSEQNKNNGQNGNSEQSNVGKDNGYSDKNEQNENSKQKQLRIYKRPRAGGKLHIKVPQSAKMVIGHTRMTTQGEAKINYNNHPFRGKAGDTAFALAHNGIIYNDLMLKATENLPKTNIETDSYAIVQLLEKQGELSFDALRSVAEMLEGIFTLTILDDKDNLYFVKGENPLCIYHYPEKNIYLYASTEEILLKALARVGFPIETMQKIPVTEGEILRIDAYGERSTENFDPFNAYRCYTTNRCYGYGYGYGYHRRNMFQEDEKETRPTSKKDKERQESAYNNYLNDLKSVAVYYGYTAEEIDELLKRGFTGDEIEEILYYEISGYIYA